MKKYQVFESIATISWLLMDFCWMSKCVKLASIFSMCSIILTVLAMIYFNGKKDSEGVLIIASLGWVLMNSFWMYSEIPGFTYALTLAKICFIGTILFVGIAIYCSIIEKDDTEFKRLKIK